MTFLLDTNVLLDFQNAELLPSLVQAAQTVDMAVAEKVFDEVTLPKANDSSDLIGKKKRAAEALQTARLEKIEIIPGTREATLMQALLAPLSTVREKDHGEAASIAIAASDARLLYRGRAMQTSRAEAWTPARRRVASTWWRTGPARALSVVTQGSERVASPEQLEVAPCDPRRSGGAADVASMLSEDALHVAALELLDDRLPGSGERQIHGQHLLDEIASTRARPSRSDRGRGDGRSRGRRYARLVRRCMARWRSLGGAAAGGLDRRQLAERYAPRDRVVELTDIARPVVVLEALGKARWEDDPLAGELDPEMLGERGDVAFSAAQRRQLDPRDSEPEEEIVAEAPLLDLVIEIAPRRGQDAHIDADPAAISDALDLRPPSPLTRIDPPLLTKTDPLVSG